MQEILNIEKINKYYKFIRPFIDKRNYHVGIYTDSAKNWYPKQTIKEIIKKQKFVYLSNGKLLQHVVSDANYGYNTSCRIKDKYLLICFDIDSHKESADRFETMYSAVEKVKTLLNIDIFVESSTKSGDLHGYIIVDKANKGASHVLMVLRMLEEILNKECLKLGLKQFEIKGMPHEYVWKNERIIDVIFSAPAKLPRDYERIDELLNLKPITIEDLHEFVSSYEEENDIIPFRKACTDENKSNGWKYYGFSSIVTAIQSDVLNNCFDKFKLKKRYIYSTHLSIFIYLCWFFKKNHITHPSLKLFKFHWNNLLEKGLIDISWNKEIVIYCRNFLNNNEFINWNDNRYCKNVYVNIEVKGEIKQKVAVKGVACSWEITEELFRHVSCLHKNKAGGGTRVTMFSLIRTGQKNRPKYDASIRFINQIDLLKAC